MIQYLLRTNGPETPLTWEGVGEHSIGRSDLPYRVPFSVSPIRVRRPSHDGNAHMANAGSKNETINLATKTVDEILADLRREFPKIKWHGPFKSLNEGIDFLVCGKTDLELFGLSENFTEADLKNTYRELMQKFHPDHQHGEEDFTEANRMSRVINSVHERLKEKLNARRS